MAGAVVANRGWDQVNPVLSEQTLATLARLNFHTMTPVQASTIPLFLSRKDVAAEAVTGSGKTLAFVIPIVETLKKLELTKWKIGALIISPTRELAVQISQVVGEFLSDLPNHLSLSQVVFIGGTSIENDLRKFEEDGGNIVVATPGRLEDILVGKTQMGSTRIKQGLKDLEMLVLDEADRLLSMGFESSINSILAFLPKQRRTGLFSATQTKDVVKLIRAGLKNPVLVSVKEKQSSSQNAPAGLENRFLICQPSKKLATLVAFLQGLNANEKIMLFLATCACVEYFALILERLFKKRNLMAIHGKKDKRHKIFDAFRKADSGILICTDVMARGIDIPDVNWVIQFDPPSNAEAFVHRSGRTARIGHDGCAVIFLLPTEDAYIKFIELNQKVQLTPMPPPDQIPTDLLKKLRDWQRNDRQIVDKATRAFVSFIHAYSKHECKFILRLKDLPFGEIAMAYGLLRMPKMPELKNRKVVGFTPDKATDFNAIRYKDKQKEKSRQEKLRQFQETGKWPGMKGPKKPATTQAWSNQVDRKAKKLERQRKKQLKSETQVESESSIKREIEEEEDDLDDLESDYKLLKRTKRSKAAKMAFDAKIELSDEDESK